MLVGAVFRVARREGVPLCCPVCGPHLGPQGFMCDASEFVIP